MNNNNKIQSSKKNIVSNIGISPTKENKNFINTKYINELKRFKNIETHTFKDISDSLEKIKTIKFEETHIIVSGLYYSQFIKVLKAV